MKFNIIKATKFTLLTFSLFILCISMFNFWQIWQLKISYNEIQNTLDRDFIATSEISSNQDISEEVVSESQEEINQINEKWNKELKDRSEQVSPNKTKTAYFQNKILEKGMNLWDRDYTTVNVKKGDQIDTVFQGDSKLSYLEWLDDRELIVYRSCGTECMIANIVDTETKKVQELALGVGYTWSPNKQFVVVYHYSYKYGISIASRGNQYGQTLLQVRRDHPVSGSGLTNQTKVTWSADSSRLAVIIRKVDEEKLELLVYNVADQFKLYFQKDLEDSDISTLTFEGLNTIIITENSIDKKISF